MYDFVKLHNAACMMAYRPVVLHAVFMSIIFEHYKQLTKLMDQKKINYVFRILQPNPLQSSTMKYSGLFFAWMARSMEYDDTNHPFGLYH